MQKIHVATPLVDIDGDEMTRIIWAQIKDKLIFPFLDLKLEYYDLHVSNRDKTQDQVTVDAAKAIKRLRVGVKCATITPDKNRVTEYSLKKEWKSPNGTIRSYLDGTVFRAPILVKNIASGVPGWKSPIIIGRHAYGDVYRNTEMKIPAAGKVELVYTPANGGAPERALVHEFQEAGVVQGQHNLDESIRHFAQSCFTYALDQKMDLWFSTKDTISKIYDARFKEIFQEEYEKSFHHKFQQAGIEYFYTLIDDAVARIMKSEGGMLWACKNYDGDVMSDMLASAFGSLALMTSVLVSPDGCFEYEAAHGTVQRHYYKHLKGEQTSTNSMASIFAWSSAIRKRGELDNTPRVVDFADKLEQAAFMTIEEGIMTQDMVRLATPRPAGHATTEGFIDAIAAQLQKLLNH